MITRAMKWGRLLLVALACTLSFTSLRAADLTLEEARTIARDAYIFGYPLAMQYRTMYVQAIDSHSKEYVGGFGRYRHYGMSTPDNKDIVTPNNDTPYSWAHVDLRTEPWVLTLPQTDGRYFTTQWMDLWHFIVDNPGSLIDGNEGGNFLLVPPDWKGETPEGIKRIVRGESEFLGTLTRTQLKGMDDLHAMQKIQQSYKLQPLSAFLGQFAPLSLAGATRVRRIRQPRRPGSGQQGYEYDILVEVTLSYVAEPRRTRRNLRRYLSTWVDWKSSKLGESLSSFRSRVLKNDNAEEHAAAGDTLRWTLTARTDHGDIEGAKRNSGTLQKDWAVVKSFQLPESFCMAVMGHQGWSKDPESEARYTLAVSFEVIGREIPIYNDLRVAVEELQAELEAESEIQIEDD